VAVSFTLVTAQLHQASLDDVPASAGCVRRAYGKYDGRLPRPPKPVLADYAAVVRSAPTWLLDGRDTVFMRKLLEPR
jgi:hypothetical protein